MKIASGTWLVLALIAISALHGLFRQVRVGEITALSVLPGEKGLPVAVFSTRGVEMVGFC